MKFLKIATTVADQISTLKKRGLTIEDEQKAAYYLSNISYYRLSAYSLSFQKFNDPSHSFMPWASFDKIIQLYVFDRELRSIILDAVERIEVALRCRIIYEYCHLYGNNWYEDPTLFFKDHNNFLALIQRELKLSKEIFISHYYEKYTEPKHPPAWMAIEILSFGQLSKMFSNLKTNDAKKAVALHFGLSNSILESWIEHLVYIRNICAHHNRLWNRTMTIKAKLPTNPLNEWINVKASKPDKIYTTICMITYLLQTVSKQNPFNGKIRTLFKRFNHINLNASGFNEKWKTDPFWINMPLGNTHRIRLAFFYCRNVIRKRRSLL